MLLTNRLIRALRPGLEGSVPEIASIERASSEDSRLRRREVREAAYVRPCSLGRGGKTPYSVVLVNLPSLDVLRGTASKRRDVLPPSVGLVGTPGVPGSDNSSNSQGILPTTSTVKI